MAPCACFPCVHGPEGMLLLFSLHIRVSPVPRLEQCTGGGGRMRAGCCTACVCAWPEPNWGYFMMVVCLGYLQTRVKSRGLRTKPVLQLPQFLKTKGPFQTLIQSGCASQEFVFRNLLRRHSGELRLPGVQADGLHPHARGTGVATGRTRWSVECYSPLGLAEHGA